jgi:hypothetical protein
MKRLLIALLLLVPGTAALAFDETRTAPRVGVLRYDDEAFGPGGAWMSDEIVRHLLEELRERGVDAFDARVTYDEAADEGFAEADYLVEIAADADAGDFGGIGVGGPHGGVELSLLVARVAAEVRVYDGRTFELISTDNLRKRNRAVLPTAVGFGGRRSWLAIAVPFAQWAQQRRVARDAARDAASKVTATLAGQ